MDAGELGNGNQFWEGEEDIFHHLIVCFDCSAPLWASFSCRPFAAATTRAQLRIIGLVSVPAIYQIIIRDACRRRGPLSRAMPPESLQIPDCLEGSPRRAAAGLTFSSFPFALTKSSSISVTSYYLFFWSSTPLLLAILGSEAKWKGATHTHSHTHTYTSKRLFCSMARQASPWNPHSLTASFHI